MKCTRDCAERIGKSRDGFGFFCCSMRAETPSGDARILTTYDWYTASIYPLENYILYGRHRRKLHISSHWSKMEHFWTLTALRKLQCFQWIPSNRGGGGAAQGTLGAFKLTRVHMGHGWPPWQVTALFSAARSCMSGCSPGELPLYSSYTYCTVYSVCPRIEYEVRQA